MSLKDKFESLKKKAVSIINEIFKLLKRPFLYYVLAAVTILISHYVFSYFGFLHTDIDSARYMLSALVQGEAAIVALVVTLSLVAVQLAAQSYSARVIEVFRKAPDLWILIAIYGVAIFYGLFVLKLIEVANPQLCAEEYICLSNLEINISFAYYFGIFAFVALVPYMLKMFEMLKPSTVINVLSERITKENILSSIDKENFEKDPILPIIDIVRGSIMKYDYETIRDGLKAIGKSTSCIFVTETLSEDEEKKISEHVFTHLTRVGKLAISRDDEEATQQVIINLHKNGIIAAKRELKETLWNAMASLQFIGISAAKKKHEASTEKAASSLEEIGKKSVEKKLKINNKEAGWWEATRLKRIGVEAAYYKMENPVLVVLDSLEQLRNSAVKKKLKNTAFNIVSSVEVIGMEAKKQELERAKHHAIAYLKNISFEVKMRKNDGEEREALDIIQKIDEALIKLK